MNRPFSALWNRISSRNRPSHNSKSTKHLRRAFFEPLEERRLLATFQESSGELAIQLGNSEGLGAVSNGSSYTLMLTGGNWTGIDSANVVGNGTATLTVTSAGLSAFNLVAIDDDINAANTSVTFNNSGANSYSDDFRVTLDHASSGTITFNGATRFSDSSSLSVAASRNIVVNSGGVVSSVNGDLSLSANQQAIPTSGNFAGIDLNGAVISSTSGAVTLKGRGGNSGSGQFGVQLRNGGRAGVGTTGPVTIEGEGGASTGNNNHGVFLNGGTSLITSSGGDVTVTGRGGGSGASSGNHGVSLAIFGFIEALGAGKLTIDASGGTGGSSHGLFLPTRATGIESTDGDITITAVAGSGAGAPNHGVYLAGVNATNPAFISSKGTGGIFVTGAGGPDPNSHGVFVDPFGVIKATAGDVQVTAQASGTNVALQVAAGGISTTTSGNVTLNADSIEIGVGSSISAPARAVVISPLATNTQIKLGNADDVGVLGLTDAELDLISAGTLTIGSSSAGAITVGASITPALATGLSLITGANIIDANTTGNDLASSSLKLESVSGIGAIGDELEIAVSQLDVQNSASGAVWLKEADSVTVNRLVMGGGSDRLFLGATSLELPAGTAGNETVRNLGAGRTDLSATGAGGGLTLGENSVRSNGLLILTTITNPIIVSSLAGAPEVIAGDTVYVDAGIVGSASNPLEVEGAKTLEINDPGAGNIYISEVGTSTITTTYVTVRGLALGTIDVDYVGSDVVDINDNADVNNVVLDHSFTFVSIDADALIRNIDVTAGAVSINALSSDVNLYDDAITVVGSGDVSVAARFGAKILDADGGTAISISTPGRVYLDGTSDIGTSASPIRFSASRLHSNTTDANQYLAPVGAMQVDGALDAGTGTIRLDSGTVSLTANNQINNSTTIDINGGTLAIGEFSDTIGGLILTSGNVTGATGVLTSTATVQVKEGAISARLGGASGVTKTTAGTVTLSGANTYTGGTGVIGGILEATKLADNGVSSSIGAGDTLYLAGGTLRYTGAGDSTNRNLSLSTEGGTIENASSTNGDLNFTNTSSLSYNGSGARSLSLVGNAGSISLAASIGDFGGPTNLQAFTAGDVFITGNNTFSGNVMLGTNRTFVGNGGNSGTLGTGLIVQGGGSIVLDRSDNFTFPNRILGAGNLTKQGSGTATLTGVDSGYIGTTTIKAGVLGVSTLANGGTVSSIGSSSKDAANLVLDGGTLRYLGQSAIIDRLFTLGLGGGVIDNSGAGNLILTNQGAVSLTGSGTHSLTLSGGSSALYSTLGDNGGPSNLTISGAGNWTIAGLNTYTGTTTIDAGSSVLVATNIGLGTQGMLGSGDIINHGSLDYQRFEPVILANNISGSGRLRKFGSQSLTLTGDSTYSGPTQVYEGSLIVNGSITSSVTVDSTLGGNGFVGDVSVNAGILAPALDGGILSMGSLSLSPTTTVDLNIDGPDAGDDYNSIIASGPISLGNAGLDLSLSLGYVPAPGKIFLLAQNDSSVAVNGTFEDLPEGAIVFRNGTPFQISYVGGDGNDITATVVNSTSVRGAVWLDDDANGVRDAGEIGMGGHVVYADLNDNGQYDPTEPSSPTSFDDGGTPEDEGGRYELILADGNYIIRRMEMVGFGPSYPTPTSGLAALTFANSSHSVSLAGQSINGIDFGNFTARIINFDAETFTVDESAAVATTSASLNAPLGFDLTVPVTVVQGTAADPDDYELLDSLIRFPAGSTRGNLILLVRNDLSFEATKSFQLQIAPTIGVNVGNVLPSQTVRIINDDPLPAVQFDAFNIQVDEADLTRLLIVRLDRESDLDTTVQLIFSGTASLGADYTLPTGTTVVIPRLTKSVAIPIQINDDNVAELGETINVRTGALQNARTSSATSSIFIRANDAPSVKFTSASQKVTESGNPVSRVSVTARLSTAPASAINVPFKYFAADGIEALKDVDFSVNSDAFHFDPTHLTSTLTFTILNDNLSEPQEFLNVELDIAALQSQGLVLPGTTLKHVVTIDDDDKSIASFESPNASRYWEDAANTSIVVSLTQPSSQTVRIPVTIATGNAAVRGTDYTLTFPAGSEGDTLVFEPGQDRKTIVLDVVNDAVQNEKNETFKLTLGTPTNAVLDSNATKRSFVGTIRDDDPTIAITSATQTVSEPGSGTTVVHVTATLSEPTNKPVRWRLNNIRGTANSDDFTLQSQASDGYWYLTIPASTLSKDVLSANFDVTIKSDNLAELQESLVLNFEQSTGAATLTNASVRTRSTGGGKTELANYQTIYISANDSPGITVSAPKTALSETTGKVNFTVSLSNPSSTDTVVPLSFGDGTTTAADFSYLPKSITIEAGKTSATGYFTINNDSIGEPLEKFNLYIWSPTSGIGSLGKPRSVAFTIGASDQPFYSPNAQAGTVLVGTDGTEYIIEPPPPGQSQLDVGALDAPDTVKYGDVALVGVGGYIVGATVIFDANKNGILDFLDLNGNGLQDIDEPTEPSALTDLTGAVQLDVSPAFDLSGDGIIDAAEGQFHLSGGIDTSVDLPLIGALIAPVGFFVPTPLTTIMASLINDFGFSNTAASQRVQEALSIPERDLRFFDQLAGTVNGDPAGPAVFAAEVKVLDTLALAASFLSSLPDSPGQFLLANLVSRDIADKILEAESLLDLGNATIVGSILDSVINQTSLVVDDATLAGVAEVIAAGNQYIDDLPVTIDAAYLVAVAKAQRVAQLNTLGLLKQLAEGQTDIASVVASQTEASLVSQIDAMAVGEIVPPVVGVTDARVVEGNDGQFELIFTLALSRASSKTVSVDFETQDGTAVAGIDYVAQAGAITWQPGERDNRTVRILINGDRDAEADETVNLFLSNPLNVAIVRGIGTGTIANDEAVQFSLPANTVNQARLELDGPHVVLFVNETPIVAGDYSQASSTTIQGADNVDDTLTLDFITNSNLLAGGVTFYGGGGAGVDSAVIFGGIFTTIVQKLTNATDGQTLLQSGNGQPDVTFNWFGLEPFLINSGSTTDLIFELPAGVTDAVLEDADPLDANAELAGKLQLRSPSGDFETTTFSSPTNSIRIRGGLGADNVTIGDLDPSFTGAIFVDGAALGSDPTAVIYSGWTQLAGEMMEGKHYRVLSKTDGDSTVTLKIQDEQPPSVVVTPDATLTSELTLTFTIQFSESVTGFTADDIAVMNGVPGAFTQEDGDTYTFTVATQTDGELKVTVASEAANDLALNASSVAAASVTVDRTGPNFTTGSDLSLPENTTSIVNVAATDLHGPVIYEFVAEYHDVAQFSLNELTGELRFKQPKDFESPVDVDRDNLYLAAVWAIDALNNRRMQQISVRVDDFNEFAISAITDVDSTLADQVLENVPVGSYVGFTAAAVDQDGSNNQVTYSLQSNPGGLLTIDPRTGRITTAAAIDREGAASIEVTVLATSADLSTSTKTVTIEILGENDNAPEFVTQDDLSVDEGNSTVGQIVAKDADLPSQTVTFQISGGVDAALFQITSDGLLSFLSPPDVESPADTDHDNVYEVAVAVSDGERVTTQTISVTVTDVPENDFGDAPASYGTTLASNGARHLAVGPRLGSLRDTEADGQPGAVAAGDGADEDGIQLPAMLFARVDAAITIRASDAGKLDGWIDFNRNGTFESNEQIASSVAVASGSTTYGFTVPASVVAGHTYARFRLSTAGGLGPVGAASDGEVEDYAVMLVSPLLGSAQIVPDPEQPSRKLLLIRGTTGNDSIVVQPNSQQPGKLSIQVRNTPLINVDPNSFDRIVVLAEAGNDSCVIHSSITKPTTLYGDAGIDSISGGSGPDIIVGGDGADTMVGNAGNDVFYAGPGNDTISGGVGFDRLVEMPGGATVTSSSIKIGATTHRYSAIEQIELAGTAGSDVFSMTSVDALVLLDAGPGSDTLVYTGDGNFILTDSLLRRNKGTVSTSVPLTSIETLRLIGGGGNDTFDLTGWSKALVLDGGGGTDTVIAANDIDYTLTDTTLQRTGLPVISQTSIENAQLTGGVNGNQFNVSRWTKTATLVGGDGIDTLVVIDNASTLTLSNTTLIGAGRATITHNGFEAAELTGGSANNTINASTFTGQLRIDGGAGDDTLTGGAGSSLLLGGLGNDTLRSGSGRAVLIGGAGLDKLTGGNNDDLLVAGQTAHDANAAALAMILAEWASPASYLLRISHLTGTAGGLNGGLRLDGGNVTHDNAVDILFGGLGEDLFFAKQTNQFGSPRDSYTDKAPGERIF